MKFLSYLLVAALAFIAACAVTSSIDPKSSDTYDFSGVQAPEEDDRDSTSYTSYYGQLTDFQKSIYDALLASIGDADSTITISNVNIADFDKNCLTATTAIQYDHPEYFWYTGGYSYKTSRVLFEEQGEITFEPIYYDYASGFFDADGKLEKLQSAVSKVAELAKQHSSDDYERMIFVHDYLIENAIYDHDGLDEYYKTSHSPSSEYIFSAYGCLVNGKTVCSGYAKAFQLIMLELGYDCSYVTGDAGEAHGWNCVYLDGEGYYVDVTWDDPDLEKETSFYNYAFITSEALSRTHTVDMPFEEPVCTATEYNYFLRRGYYSETYDFTTASAILSQQSNNSSAHIQFGSVEELGKAYTDIIENNKLGQIPGADSFTSYYYNEDHYTLTFLK